MPLQSRILGNTDPLVTSGANCPIDSSPFHVGDEIVICEVCKTAHHTHCWQKNGNRCSTLGCSGAGEVAILRIKKEELLDTSGKAWLLTLDVRDSSGYGMSVDKIGVVTKALMKLSDKPIHFDRRGNYLKIQYRIFCSTVLDAHAMAHKIIDDIKSDIQGHGIAVYDYSVVEELE